MKSTSKVADASQIVEAVKLWQENYDLSIFALNIPAIYQQVEVGTKLYAMDCFSIEELEALKKHGSYVMEDIQSVFSWTTNPADLEGSLKHFSVVGAFLIEKNVSEFEVVLNFAFFISQNKQYEKEFAHHRLMQNRIFVKSTKAARTITYTQVG